MKRVLVLIWGIIFKPAPTFRRILEEKPMWLAVSIVFIFGVSLALFSQLTSQEIPIMAKRVGLFLPLIYLAVWVIFGILLQKTGRSFGGRGTFKDTLLVIGIAPVVILLVQLFSSVLYRFIQAGPLLWRILGALMGIWFVAIIIVGIREAHRFSVMKAILAFLITVVLCAFVIWFITSAVPSIIFAAVNFLSGLFK